MKTVLTLAIALTVIVSTLWACMPAPPAGLPQVIPVGCLMASTSAPAWGPNLINAARLAVSEINGYGGINGSQIALVIEDEGPTAASSLLALHKLIDGHKVQVVIGCTTSDAALETGPYAASRSVPIVSPSATSNIIARNSWSNWIFRIAPDDSLQGGVIAKLIKDRGLKRIAVLQQNTAYGHGVAEMAIQFLKGRAEIVTSISYDPAKLSYMAELNAIKDKQPDCILHIGYYNDGAVVYRQAGELGLETLPWFAVDGVYDMPLGKYLEAAKFMERSVTGTVPLPDLQSEVYTTFRAKYISSYQADPTIYCDDAYDGMTLISMALKKANSYSGRNLRDALASTGKDFKGASGTVTFDNNGARIAGNYGVWKVHMVGTQYRFVLTGESVSFLKNQ
jgi:branched-chain amino acid transport system substrate-binding protein